MALAVIANQANLQAGKGIMANAATVNMGSGFSAAKLATGINTILASRASTIANLHGVSANTLSTNTVTLAAPDFASSLVSNHFNVETGAFALADAHNTIASALLTGTTETVSASTLSIAQGLLKADDLLEAPVILAKAATGAGASVEELDTKGIAGLTTGRTAVDVAADLRAKFPTASDAAIQAGVN